MKRQLAGQHLAILYSLIKLSFTLTMQPTALAHGFLFHLSRLDAYFFDHRITLSWVGLPTKLKIVTTRLGGGAPRVWIGGPHSRVVWNSLLPSSWAEEEWQWLQGATLMNSSNSLLSGAAAQQSRKQRTASNANRRGNSSGNNRRLGGKSLVSMGSARLHEFMASSLRLGS
ncbi:hypothetical protein NL676_025798 [Syzygium grande]|nr:hypothetical protein NL676_025798 [Syzygium grande]